MVTALNVPPPTAPVIAHPVTEVEPPPFEPVGVTEIVVVVAPAIPAGKVTVVNAALGAGAYVNVGATMAAGQVIVEVNAGNAAPAGFAVWAQLSVVVVAAACGVQLRPIAGAFAPTVAGALMVRFAPAVIANAAVLAGIVQASATLAVATPAVATVTAAVPVPPVKVTAAGSALRVGAVWPVIVPFWVAHEPAVSLLPFWSVHSTKVAVNAIGKVAATGKLIEPME